MSDAKSQVRHRLLKLIIGAALVPWLVPIIALLWLEVSTKSANKFRDPGWNLRSPAERKAIVEIEESGGRVQFDPAIGNWPVIAVRAGTDAALVHIGDLTNLKELWLDPEWSKNSGEG